MSGEESSEMQSGIKLCTHEVVFDGNFLTCEMLNEFAFHVYISGNNFWKKKITVSLSIKQPLYNK